MRVLVVDDHAVVRRGVRDFLLEAFPGCAVVEAANADEALRAFESGTWDLVVLDLEMPGRGGLDVLKVMFRQQPQVPVLVLSAHAESQYANRARRAGARGYLTKGSSPEEIVLAARTLVAGQAYVSSSLEAGPASASEPHLTLSDRELQVFLMLARGQSVKQIGAELELSDKTISTYRARILDKMNMQTNAQLMRYALLHGLVD